jgi:hypothetical protein
MVTFAARFGGTGDGLREIRPVARPVWHRFFDTLAPRRVEIRIRKRLTFFFFRAGGAGSLRATAQNTIDTQFDTTKSLILAQDER